MKKFLIVLSVILAFILGACSSVSVSAEQTNPLKIWYHNDNGCYGTLCVVDETTGVNYVVAEYNGANGAGIAICPRYNADGTLYTS